MVEQDDRDGSTNRPWWVDALDPVENLRALTNVQDFGRQAAEELADRLLTRGGERSDATLSEADLDRLVRRFQTEAARAGEVLVNLIDLFATLVSGLGARPPRRPERGPGGASVMLEGVAPGTEATAVFWIHNTSPSAIPAVRPHCTPLRSHLGHELATGAVRFDPEVFDPLPARSSCGVELRCRVPPGATPGGYASLILVSNLPELFLPLRVTVKGEAEE
ncbi:MAG TPA: hypothetical protein VHO93_17015 [Actinomycetota bacterium]|jgi:hypothetical protein|nr:hypothetical protein [Actinomycetota bacterium]